MRRAGATPASPGGGSAACGRDARAPRRWQCGMQARRPRPQEVAVRCAGEMPAPPGGAGTRTVPARQEHSRTTMGRLGRNASYLIKMGLFSQFAHLFCDAQTLNLTRSRWCGKVV